MAGLSGALSFANCAEILQRSDELTASVTLDISGVSRADSAGLALLLELSRRAKSAGRTLTLTGINPQVLALAKFFEIDGALKLEPGA